MPTSTDLASREPAIASGTLAIAVLNTAAMTVLFGSEIGFVALSLDWSLAGLFGLGPAVYYPIAAVPVVAAAYATYWIARRTWRFERAAATGAEGEAA